MTKIWRKTIIRIFQKTNKGTRIQDNLDMATKRKPEERNIIILIEAEKKPRKNYAKSTIDKT